MKQMTGTVRQNADNAHHANNLALAAAKVAAEGGAAVSAVVKQAALAARRMQHQAVQLGDLIAQFKLVPSMASAPVPRRPAANLACAETYPSAPVSVGQP